MSYLQEAELNFYLASNYKVVKTQLNYNFSSRSLDNFNQLYAEKLLFNLAYHYEAYLSKNSTIWNLNQQGQAISPSNFSVLNKKERMSGVSGNVGECLIVPSLQNALDQQNGLCQPTIINYCRLTSAKKCPDFLVELNYNLLNLWQLNRNNLQNYYPDYLPLEVKSHFGSDNQYPKEALLQLLSYWCRALSDGNKNSVGVGIVARVNLKKKTVLRYFLFIPKNDRSKERIEWICRSSGKPEKKIKIIQERIEKLFL